MAERFSLNSGIKSVLSARYYIFACNKNTMDLIVYCKTRKKGESKHKTRNKGRNLTEKTEKKNKKKKQKKTEAQVIKSTSEL